MISRFKALIKKAVGISTTDKVECAVDETKVDCSSLGEAEAFRNDALRHYEAYTGIPAPAYLEDDTWFAPPIHSQKQLDYMEQETHIKQQQYQETHTDSVESEDIHQKMYEIATRNQSTTLHLNPPGGSENYQSGPGGWSSGTGYNQYR